MGSGDMTFSELLSNITPEIYANLRRAVERGKWANGSKLTSDQREHAMQAMLAWEMGNLPENQRTGYMEQSCQSSADKNRQKNDTTIQSIHLTRH